MAYTANKKIVDLEAKATLLDADVVAVGDTADSDRAKKTTWAELKTNLSGTYQPLDSVLTNTTASFTTADETKLDGIETAATADQTGAEIKTAYEAEADTNAFTDAEQTKLAGIETAADVTDATNVAAAGAPIITSGAGVPSSTPAAVGDIYVDTTNDNVYVATDTASSADWDQATGAGGGDLLAANNLSDLANAATARTNLGVDAAGTDNSTDVTLSGAGTYIGLTGQDIQVDAITEGDITLADVTTNDVTTSAHGFAPKAPNDTTTFLRGDATWATPSIGASDAVEKTVYNSSGATLSKGKAVYIDGWNVGNGVPTVQLARADSATTMPALGIVQADITNNSTGTIVVVGTIEGEDTSGFALDAALYVDPTTAGDLTATKPVGSNLIQAVARVTRVNVANGVFFVAGALRTNDIPNFTAADKYWYGGTDGVTTEGTITSAGRAILDDADASAQRTTLGVAIGSDVQAYSAALDSVTGTNTGDEVALVASEINTGTDTTKYATADALAGSNFGIRYVSILCFDYGTDTATGDGKGYFHIPSGLDSMNLVSVHAEVFTAGTTGTTDVQIHNVDNALDMLSTKLTIDSAETGSDTAATAAVINTSNDHVNTNDVIRIDVDAVSTTAAKGLLVTMGFQLA